MFFTNKKQDRNIREVEWIAHQVEARAETPDGVTALPGAGEVQN